MEDPQKYHAPPQFHKLSENMNEKHTHVSAIFQFIRDSGQGFFFSEILLFHRKINILVSNVED